MKSLILLSVTALTFASTLAHANPAMCERYTANMYGSLAPVVVKTWVSDWTRETGYTDVGTSIEGSYSASCKSEHFNLKTTALVCGVQLVNVAQDPGATDCFGSTDSLKIN